MAYIFERKGMVVIQCDEVEKASLNDVSAPQTKEVEGKRYCYGYFDRYEEDVCNECLACPLLINFYERT